VARVLARQTEDVHAVRVRGHVRARLVDGDQRGLRPTAADRGPVTYIPNGFLSQGGMYVFQLMDTYSASGISLLWVCFFQTVAVSWFFGADRFRECVKQMLGFRPSVFWHVCWVYLAPFVMMVSRPHLALKSR